MVYLVMASTAAIAVEAPNVSLEIILMLQEYYPAVAYGMRLNDWLVNQEGKFDQCW